jgi:hypothetical protein
MISLVNVPVPNPLRDDVKYVKIENDPILPGSPTGEQAGHEDKNDCQPFENEARVHRPFRC